ncbi:hypothetical protein [Archangium sp.]|uniref:hypothetical protein n=1 Tax=Archangium sp. TaxID=1872627 RepID=UPI002D72785F|nr:hypothetical protein [Archangium sp.]HYO60204.1 hypothetical protein [Archangium sp.]
MEGDEAPARVATRDDADALLRFPCRPCPAQGRHRQTYEDHEATGDEGRDALLARRIRLLTLQRVLLVQTVLGIGDHAAQDEGWQEDLED